MPNGPASPDPGAPTGHDEVPRNTSRHSIINGKSGRQSRTDNFGNAIEKGKKMHRCTFPDEQDPRAPVEEKIEVVSYKGAGGWNNYESQPGCSCSLM
mmetsp:Transcript_106123/g.310246  ORF Transcript_106123/g.310246 Transcript_106123/m.310246 type:complete len:97 (+) Transcript_106123:131-421(+)